MPPAMPTRTEIERLLAQNEFIRAKDLAGEFIRRNPRDGEAWLAVARAALGVARYRVAEEALTRAERTLGNDPRVSYWWSVAEHYLGRSEPAAARLRALIDQNAPNALEACIFLVDVLHRTGKREEMHALIRRGGAWLNDPRARVLAARALADDDKAAAAAELERIAREPGDPQSRRNAGFEAVLILDKMGEYRHAYDLATYLHAEMGHPFDREHFMGDIDEQQQLLSRGKPWFLPRVPEVDGISFIVGMPRSGTTLLEQMLDRHSQIAGIGEYEGIYALGSALKTFGYWPRGLGTIDQADAQRQQDEYLASARTPEVAGKRWLVDKSLHTWHFLPAVAAILPGARCIHVARDPRDTAVSLFTQNFHPKHAAWTRTVEGIRTVMAAERALSLHAMDVLRIPHEAIVYEDLVEDPNHYARRVTDLFGVEAEPAMLQPEKNSRTVLTLSHEQVRRPINKASVARWKNYEWMFGPEWDDLVALHESRRTRK